MHERKASMAEESDAFIALPGNYMNYPKNFITTAFIQYTVAM